MKKLLTLLTILCISEATFSASWLVQNGVVEKIWTTNSNQKMFYIKFSSYNGPCSEINFKEEDAQSTVAYAQAFALATSAFIHNKKLEVFSYIAGSPDCNRAQLVGISN